MKPKEICGLVLRVVGLVGLLYACRHIFILIHKTGTWHLGWLLHKWDKTGRADESELRTLLIEIVVICFGIYLLQGAPRLMKFMFPEEKKGAANQDVQPKG